VAQSVLVDHFFHHLPSLEAKCRRKSKERRVRGTKATAVEWQKMLDTGLVQNRAELARKLGVSRARVTQALRVDVIQ